MKWHPNMTEQQEAAFKAEIDAIDAAYADAAKLDALNAELIPEEYEDEMETLRRAALDSKGRP
jgi:hypothetical protein